MTAGPRSPDLPADDPLIDLTVDEPGLDLSVDEPLVTQRLPYTRLATEAPFSPERLQEWVRTGVALSIVGAVIVETLILTSAFVAGGIAANELTAVTSAIVTPMIGIAGTVLGFYFGSQRGGRSA